MVVVIKVIDWFASVFGEYQPVMTDVYIAGQDALAHVVASGAAGVDWPYIGRVAVFCIVLYSFFRVLGGLICNS